MGKKDKAEKAAENIKVIVRCRPLNGKERDNNYKSCVDLNIGESTVQVNHVCGDPDRWTFDGVVNNTFMQKDVFTQFIQPLIDSVMDGFNATVFAYGQSGSGKTHTMTGKLDDEELKGIIPRTFEYVFANVKEQQKGHPNRQFTIGCTFVELYNGKIHDLLAKQQVPLAVKENKDKTFFVQGVVTAQSKFPEELLRHMEEGTERRRVASTDLNADSSRSHSLFTLSVDMVDTDDDGTTRSVTSKFNLVDLAGSERQSKTGAAGDTLKEGCNINLSLSALGTVIDTLVKGKGHVPFRSSPLTMLLKDSLGGSSKTVMFANIGPSEHNLSETVSTLRFADRAKQIKNKPVVNLDSKDQKIQELTDQVQELKERLKQFESVGVAKMEEELEALREKVGELEVDLDNAVKSREGEALQAQQTKDTLDAEVARLSAEGAEQRDTIDTLTAEGRLKDEELRDGKMQLDEIWRSCTEQFGVDVSNVDDLLERLRVLASGISKEEHVHALSELRSQLAAATAEKDEVLADLAAARTDAQRLTDDLESLQKKLDKAKERLDREKGARKLLVSEGSSAAVPNAEPGEAQSPGVLQRQASGWAAQRAQLEEMHEEEIGALQETIRDLERRVAEAVSPADLAKAQNEKDVQIAQLQEQVRAITDDICSENADDDAKTARLKLLVKQQELALHQAHANLKKAEEQVLARRHRVDVRDADASGERAEASVTSPDQVLTGVLGAELQATAEHRDQLLLDLVGEGAEAGSHDSQAEKLVAENARLRQHVSASAQVATELATAKARVAELEAERVEQRSAQTSSLAAEKDRLIDELRCTREEAHQREAELIAKLSATHEGGDESGDDDRENPLVEVVALLQRDKAALTAELARVARHSHHHAALPNSNPGSPSKSEERSEIRRLKKALSTPKETDSEEVVALKLELTRRDQQIDDIANTTPGLGATFSGGADGAEADTSMTVVAEAQHKAKLLELENGELAEQLEALRAEVEEANARRVAATEAAQHQAQDLAAKGKEVSQLRVESTELNNRVTELTAELEKYRSDGSSSAAALESLQTRLKERSEQAQELRKVIEHTKEVADGHKARVDQVKIQMATMQREQGEREVAHQSALAEQEASFQRLLNRRLEQQSEELKKAASRKDEDVAYVRKKVKKLEDKVERLKEKYDGKVYEYEELVSRMEEQKFEAMRNMRDRETVVIEESQAKVQDALKAAKERNRMKADLFANGTVDSAVSGLRPVGSATSAARSKNVGTPPSEGVEPRPAGYTAGKAVVVGSSAPSGGAGYTGYVPEPSSQSTRRKSNAGVDSIAESYLEGGGGSGGGDIYDF